MIEKRIRSLLREAAEQKAPAAEIDLWPALQTHLPLRDRPFSRGIPMNQNARISRYRLALALTTALILAGIVFFTAPQTHAMAQTFLHFFTRSQSDALAAPTSIPLVWQDTTPSAPPLPTLTPTSVLPFESVCGPRQAAHCSVEQLRSMVKFPVQELGQMPQGISFVGGNGGPDLIVLTYANPDHSNLLVMFESPWTGSPQQTHWDVGASAAIETVKMKDSSGEYVKGSFGYSSGAATEQWDANAAVQTLRWTENGVFFTLQNVGDSLLTRADLVSLASALTDQSVSAQVNVPTVTAAPTDEPFDLHKAYPLTLAEAQKAAGFTLAQPAKLPEILSFLGAAYDADHQITRMIYPRAQSDMAGSTDSLSLAQERIPAKGAVCNLCSMVVGDKTMIDQYPAGTLVGDFQEVKIGSGSGQYTEGGWHGTNCCGWEWASDPYLKTLRWQKDGIAFELTYMGLDLNQQDLIRIAENVK